MAMRLEELALSANEAACVTGVPPKQVHRIVDAGLLGDSVKSRKGARVILKHALVGLRLAHKTTDILTLEGRRRCAMSSTILRRGGSERTPFPSTCAQ